MVPAQDRFERELAETRPVEHHLDQHRAGQHVAELKAGDGDDREDRIGQRMAKEHGAVAQPLRPRGPDVFGAEHVEHAGARDPAVLREENDRESDRGQRQVMGDVERQEQARAVCAHIVHAGQREQGNRGGEEKQQHDPGPEHGRRIADEGEHGDEIRDEATGFAGSEHAEIGAEGERDRHGGHDQQHRRPEAVEDEIDDRRVEEQRVSEIARQHPLQVECELMVQGTVQAVGLADIAKDLLGDAAHPARDGQRRVAGREADEDEVEDENRQDQRGSAEEAASEDRGELHVSFIPRPFRGRLPQERLRGAVGGEGVQSRSAQRSSQTRSMGCIGPHTVSGRSMTYLRDTVT